MKGSQEESQNPTLHRVRQRLAFALRLLKFLRTAGNDGGRPRNVRC